MSLDATRWAWQQRIKPASLKLLLLALADRASPDSGFECFPTIDRLCADTGLDRKTIIDALDRLASVGLIVDTGKRVGATKRTPVYRLIGPIARDEERDVTHFVYRTTDQETGEFYIGVHSTVDDDGRYKGSGKWVTTHPDPTRLRREVLAKFSTRSEAEVAEARMISECIGNTLCRNKATEAHKLNSPENGTVSNSPENGTINKPENGTVRPGNSPENGTLNSPENGTQNQSRNHRGKYSPITPSSDPGKEKPKTGTRLPDDWTLPDEWLNWAATNTTIPPTKIPAIADGFKDYWIAKAGKDGRKADWFATWRNWIRREAERYGGPHEARNPIPDRPKSKSQEFDEFMRKIDDRIERLREHEQRVSGVGSDLWGEMESPMD
jgi:hypothetical protein